METLRHASKSNSIYNHIFKKHTYLEFGYCHLQSTTNMFEHKILYWSFYITLIIMLSKQIKMSLKLDAYHGSTFYIQYLTLHLRAPHLNYRTFLTTIHGRKLHTLTQLRNTT